MKKLFVAAVGICLLSTPAPAADPAAPNDLLNAELWMQSSVEYRANCLGAFALARLRLDEALADRNWTAYDQTGTYQELPPAVVLDLDETALDNAGYEAWLTASHSEFSPKAWDTWIKTRQATAVPGAVEFTRYADQQGVRVFYVTNRNAAQKEDTKRNLTALGFPVRGNVDTLLTKNEKPEWSSNAKGVRIASIARDYRILLLFGDQFGDFTDKYDGGIGERDKVFEALKAHFGHDWIVLANPAYGSWESATYGHDFRLSPDAKRAAKFKALRPWQPPP